MYFVDFIVLLIICTHIFRLDIFICIFVFRLSDRLYFIFIYMSINILIIYYIFYFSFGYLNVCVTSIVVKVRSSWLKKR